MVFVTINTTLSRAQLRLAYLKHKQKEESSATDLFKVPKDQLNPTVVRHQRTLGNSEHLCATLQQFTIFPPIARFLLNPNALSQGRVNQNKWGQA